MADPRGAGTTRERPAVVRSLESSAHGRLVWPTESVPAFSALRNPSVDLGNQLANRPDVAPWQVWSGHLERGFLCDGKASKEGLKVAFVDICPRILPLAVQRRQRVALQQEQTVRRRARDEAAAERARHRVVPADQVEHVVRRLQQVQLNAFKLGPERSLCSPSGRAVPGPS
jgi:hypothetical protein